MVTAKQFRELALSFEQVVEQPHFHKQSFRINKKIFATLDEAAQTATLKLPEAEQSVFCLAGKAHISPATGAWGKGGWTIIQLKNIPKAMVADALTVSYKHVSNKKKN